MEWADARVWNAVEAAPAAGTDAKIQGLLFHLQNMQWAFLKVWDARPLEWPKPGEFSDLAALRAWSGDYHRNVAAFLDGLQTDALDEPLRMPWVAEFERRMGQAFANPTLGDTLFQVTSHSTYHRGQVSARLRELGGEPPLVDFIAWVWLGKASAERVT